MSVTITAIAAQHIKDKIQERGKGLGIRLGVRTSGCSGMAYVLEFVDEAESEDHMFEHHGATLFIDPKSIKYLNGTEVDYVYEGLNEGFTFKNPNVKNECGCGESFHV